MGIVEVVARGGSSSRRILPTPDLLLQITQHLLYVCLHRAEVLIVTRMIARCLLFRKVLA